MRTIRVALVQFDARPEQLNHNRARMVSLVHEAVSCGARWTMFHEATVCDYTADVARDAECVPDGPTTQAVASVAREHNCFVSFGLSEKADDRFYVSQVFVGPMGLIHCYRKTWLWRSADDEGNRNEWARYDPGTGPELFEFDGVQATCFICADGEAPRCIHRARNLRPQVVFYPNNRAELPAFEVIALRAREIGAPMLVTNRTGASWVFDCQGGCVAYSGDGETLAAANRVGREEILILDLSVPAV